MFRLAAIVTCMIHVLYMYDLYYWNSDQALDVWIDVLEQNILDAYNFHSQIILVCQRIILDFLINVYDRHMSLA